MFGFKTTPRTKPPVPVSGSESSVSNPLPSSEKQYLSGLRLWGLFVATSLTASLIVLYVMIIATAIPSITADFNTIADLDWYSTAYLLTLCAMQPLAGKIFTFFPLKSTYLVFLFIFEVGNLICALAPTSAAFIAGRAVAGLGAAALFNGGMVMFAAAAHPSIRPTVIGIGMAVTAIGGVVGPVMGGAITDHLGWRWCLWIFLPPGGLAAVLFAIIYIPEQTAKQPVLSILPSLPQKLDVIGFALFAPACVMVLLAMSWGGQRYAWGSAAVIGLFVGSAATAVLFGAWQRFRGDRALIPPRILLKPVVFYGCLVSFLQGGSFLMMGYYLPLWFQSVLRASPTRSGVMLLPTMAAQIVSSTVAGALVSRVGYVPPWALIGNALSAIGSGLMTTFVPTSRAGSWIGFQVLVGIGRGFVLQMPVIALQGVLSGIEISTGTAMTMFCQYFGGTVFLAIAKSLFANGLRKALQEYAPRVDPEVVINAGVVNVFNVIPPADVQGVTLAYNKALAATFWLPTVAAILAFAFSFGFGWKKVASPRPKGPPGSGRAGPPGASEEKQAETAVVSSSPEEEGKPPQGPRPDAS